MSFIQFCWMSGIILTLQGPLAPIHLGHMHAPQVSASDSLNVTETFTISIVTIYKKDGIGLVG